jgi:hypothetical protein
MKKSSSFRIWRTWDQAFQQKGMEDVDTVLDLFPSLPLYSIAKCILSEVVTEHHPIFFPKPAVWLLMT